MRWPSAGGLVTGGMRVLHCMLGEAAALCTIGNAAVLERSLLTVLAASRLTLVRCALRWDSRVRSCVLDELLLPVQTLGAESECDAMTWMQ